MKEAEVIVFLKEYSPSIMFVFFGRELSITNNTPQLYDMCNACLIGHQQIPWINLTVMDFIKTLQFPNTMD